MGGLGSVLSTSGAFQNTLTCSEYMWEVLNTNGRKEERVVKIPSLQENTTGLTTRGLNSRQGVPGEENKASERCVGRRIREKTWVFLGEGERERERERGRTFVKDLKEMCGIYIYMAQDRRYGG